VRNIGLAWEAMDLLPFLKHHSETLAKMLVEKSQGRPLRSGVTWVLGELGVVSAEVLDALERTTKSFAKGSGSSPFAWWESAFALEKLGQFGPRKGRQGDEAINFLIEHLPPRYTLERARENMRRILLATDPRKARVDPGDIVTIVKHESEIDLSELYRQILALVDFSTYTRRRCYYVVWLCGHLGMRESLGGVVKATRNPSASVRNIACEALGKMGFDSPPVIEALEDGLADNYYRTRFHAAWSLGELGSVDSIPRLSAAIKVEEVRDVREEMIQVRDSLERRSTSSEISPP